MSSNRVRLVCPSTVGAVVFLKSNNYFVLSLYLLPTFIIIYQDDLIVFSKERGDRVKHLRAIFKRCKMYGITVNPKKSSSVVDMGKLFINIVSKDGISINLKRVEAINKIEPSTRPKALRSFFGKIKFVRKSPASLS